MSTPFDTIVIGAGHNGMVTAAYLACAGQHVAVLEKRDMPGGMAVTEEIFPGFRVDTLAHRVTGFNRKIVKDLELSSHGLQFRHSDPCVFIPSESDRHLVIWRDPARTAEELRSLSAADAEAWMPFTELVHKAAAFLQATWTVTPPDLAANHAADLWSLARLGLRLRRGGRKDMASIMHVLPMSVFELLDEWFESDLLRGALAMLAVRGMHQGPMAGGTAHTFLHQHVGAARGEVFPTQSVIGGIGGLTHALAAACRQHGAEVRTGSPVARIMVEDGRATGVVLTGGEQIRAERVVSGADPRTTFAGLLNPAQAGPDFASKVRNIRFRGVNARVHLVLGGLPDFVCRPGPGDHLNGTIAISPGLEYVERAYDDTKYGRVSRAPCLEMRIPSLTDPSIAPAGKHLASIDMQYAPFRLADSQWDESAQNALGDLVVQTLARYAPGFESLVEQRHVLTPLDLQQQFSLTEGNVHHGEMTLDQLHFMRPVAGAARYRAPIGALYLCGSGTHPGGGVTGVPGYNAAREILKAG